MAKENIDHAKKEMQKVPWNATTGLDWIAKIDVWKAMIIADEAVINWARRHARLAKIVAEHFETNQERKEELLEIADISHRVPAEPCKGLKDAFQAKWYTFLLCHAIDRYASGYAHKEDELLEPYYNISVKDKSFQPMTHTDVIEMVEMERLKISEHGAGKSRAYREIFPGSNDLFILTIGGTKPGYVDACSDMTDAILEGARNIRTTEPSIVFRWHPNGREKTKHLVFECIRDGLGYPSIKHDVIGTEQLKYYSQFSKNNNGATDEEAITGAWCCACLPASVEGARPIRPGPKGGDRSSLPR
nr:pyruvate formate lyase family protein [Geotalea toluenoxydans]